MEEGADPRGLLEVRQNCAAKVGNAYESARGSRSASSSPKTGLPPEFTEATHSHMKVGTEVGPRLGRMLSERSVGSPILANCVTNGGTEDEVVRDLRRALSEKIATSSDGVKRTQSNPELRSREQLLHPDLGRLRDVAQPGGFRRQHVQSQEQECVHGRNSHSNTILVQLLLPLFCCGELLEENLQGDSYCSEMRSAHCVEANSVERRDSGSAGTFATMVIMIKVFFSSFVLMAPGGYKNAGIVGGPLCLYIVFFFEIAMMLRLLAVRKAVGPGYRYEDLGIFFGGQWGSELIRFLVVLSEIGFCSVWFVTGVDNLRMILPSWNDSTLLWVSLPVLLPLVWIRHLRLLACTNIFATLCQLIIVVYLICLAASELRAKGPKDVLLLNTSPTIVKWLGSCAYAFEGVNCLLPIYEAAIDKENFNKLFVTICVIIVTIHASFAAIFFAAFGDETNDMATTNIPQGSIAALLAPGAMVIVGFCTNPINFLLLAQMYEPRRQWSDNPLARKLQKNFVRGMVLVGVLALTWLGGSSLQNVLGLVGGFCCSSLALVVPAMLDIIVCKPKACIIILDAVSITLGIFIMISSTVVTISTW
eukprot:TRINITY_DN23737_c0_g1_i1.p1 TRINITY_DN23737_c0_g1~~TRINITY_DN23737_c0_g1_i1.p1  ORF type:complete len:603 (-),score=58.47 TRINITY_DN23737_c0_g1_i1:67-1839(-)